MGVAVDGLCHPAQACRGTNDVRSPVLPQQGHLFFFCQLGIVDADLSRQDIHAHPEFPRIVFHGLRHSSATYQLMISGGDIKAVQGTTGHASADMLVNTYAHIQQSSRVELGKKFESGFYAKPDTPSPQANPPSP